MCTDFIEFANHFELETKAVDDTIQYHFDIFSLSSHSRSYQVINKLQYISGSVPGTQAVQQWTVLWTKWAGRQAG